MSRDVVNNRLKTIVVVPLTTYGDQMVQIAEQPPFRIVLPPEEFSADVLSQTNLTLR